MRLPEVLKHASIGQTLKDLAIESNQSCPYMGRALSITPTGYPGWNADSISPNGKTVASTLASDRSLQCSTCCYYCCSYWKQWHWWKQLWHDRHRNSTSLCQVWHTNLQRVYPCGSKRNHQKELLANTPKQSGSTCSPLRGDMQLVKCPIKWNTTPGSKLSCWMLFF